MTKDKSAAIEKKKVVTPKFRVSFPAIIKPKAFENQEPKYSVVMLFDKATDLAGMKLAASNAATEKWGPDRKDWPKFRYPTFRDGDDERAHVQGYANTIFVTASSKNQPGLVDNALCPILAEADFYAGCYARAELIAFAYDKAGNKGVGFSLQNLQKLGDGEKFSGRKDASAVFDKVEDGSDDESSYGNGEDGGEQAQDGMGF